MTVEVRDTLKNELVTAIELIYDEAVYDLSIDYSQKPPPPVLSDEEAAWLVETVASEQ